MNTPGCLHWVVQLPGIINSTRLADCTTTWHCWKDDTLLSAPTVKNTHITQEHFLLEQTKDIMTMASVPHGLLSRGEDAGIAESNGGWLPGNRHRHADITAIVVLSKNISTLQKQKPQL